MTRWNISKEVRINAVPYGPTWEKGAVIQAYDGSIYVVSATL